MTCTQSSKPPFKGVVITSCILMVLSSCCTAVSVAEDRQTKALTSTNSGRPYCVYLEPSQELDCVCHDSDSQEEGQHETAAPVTFPSDEFLLQASVTDVDMHGNTSSVASIKLHSCRQLHLRLDLRPLPRPFYRLRLEDVQRVILDGVTLLPNDTVDIWFRNVNATVDVSGHIGCYGCDSAANADAATPNLNLHLLDVRNITFRDLIVDGANPFVKVRNADRLLIKDSFFKSLPKDSLEIFNVPWVYIDHSEFHDVSQSSILLNRVQNFTARDSLLEHSALEVLKEKNSTRVHWDCTVSPLVDPSDVLSETELAECSTHGGRFSSRGLGSEAGGAIFLAVVSAVMLILAVTVLIVMHRSGKLEPYL